MDLHPLWDWFRVLNETTGVKLTIFYDTFDRARFFNGFLTSVRLMAVCLVASVVIGVVGAWIQGSRLRVLRLITQGYIQFFRNTPPLVQLYFFYFALGSYLKVTTGNGIAVPIVSNFTWAAICLSFYAGAFNVEIFRAGIEAVPRGFGRAQAVPLAKRRAMAFHDLAWRCPHPRVDHRRRHRRGAGRGRRQAGHHRHDPEVDAAAGAGLRAQHRDELPRDGDRHRG